MEDLWETTDLENLHSHLTVDLRNYVERVTSFQAKCDRHAHEINGLLLEYLHDVVQPYVGTITHVQSAPTFRAHFSVRLVSPAGHEILARTLQPRQFLERFYTNRTQPSVRGFHTDSQHRLPGDAINVWTALTDSFGTNSLWLGHQHNEGWSSRPISVPRGTCLLFNGAKRWHGTVCNTSGQSRVSFDVRVLTR